MLQHLLHQVTQGLGIKAEEVTEDSDPMMNILALSGPSRIALLLIKTIVDTSKTLWQTPASLPPTAKCNEQRYFVPSKGYEHLYSHLQPDSLVVDAANQCECQVFQGPSPKNREAKKLYLFQEEGLFHGWIAAPYFQPIGHCQSVLF